MPVNPLNPLQKFLTTDVVRLEVETRPPGIKNLVANPSGALGAYWWTAADPNAFVRPTTAAGAVGLRYMHGTAGSIGSLRTGFCPVEAGEYVGARFTITQVTANRQVAVRIEFYNAFRQSIGVSATTTVTALDPVTPRYIGGSLTAPANTKYVRLSFELQTTVGGAPSVNDLFVVREVMVTAGATDPGTAYPFVEPFAFENILAGAYEIKINRPTLDVGTLAAAIVDPAFDPATDTAKRLVQGRRIRVVAFLADFNTWEPIFTGSIRDLRTDYVLDKDEPGKVRPRVSLTATDALADLANVKWPYSYEVPLELTNAFESGPVPWWIEGSSAFGYPVAGTRAHNARASVLDQVAITRDSVGYSGSTLRAPGHAWLDRRGVLQLWQQPPAERTYLTWLNPVGGSPSMVNATSEIVANVTTHAGVARNVYRLTATASGNVVARDFASQLLPIKAGATYDVSVWVKAVSTARATTLSLEFESEGDLVFSTATIATATDTAPDNNGWRQLTGRFTAPLEAREIKRLVTFAGCAAGEQHYVDELQVTPVPIAYTDTTLPSAHADSYTDLRVDYAAGSIINTLTVNYLRAVSPPTNVWGQPIGDPPDAETIVYGPYVDQNSVDAHGAFAATLTLAGNAENPTKIEAVAQAVLSANAQPARIARNMHVAVQDAAGIRHAVLTDLCDLVDVDYDGLIDSSARVREIEHHITPRAWLVEYGFEPSKSVPMPQVVPSTVVGTTTDGWRVVGAAGEPAFENGWSNYGSTEVARFRRDGNRVSLNGRVKHAGTINTNIFTLPAGYRPSAIATYLVYAGTGGNGFGVVVISPTGGVMWATAGSGGSTAQVDLSQLSFVAEN